MNELGFFTVTLVPVVWIVAAYLLGSIAFGILVSKLFGLPDPRTVGSGNPGATNVLRSGKKAAAALTLLGDAFKGWFPVWLAMQFDNIFPSRHTAADVSSQEDSIARIVMINVYC